MSVRQHLRMENAVHGEPKSLRVDEATCVFVVTLPGKNLIPPEKYLLVAAKDRDLLERVRQQMIALGGDCGEITDPPERTGEGLSTRFEDYPTFYHAGDGKARHLLEQSVRLGRRCWYGREQESTR